MSEPDKEIPAGKGVESLKPAAVAVLASAAVSTVLCFLPLTNILGFEFSFAISIFAFLTGPLIIVQAKRSSWRWRGIFAATAAVSAIPAAVSALNALRVVNCSLAEGAAFYALIALPTFFLLAAFTCMAVSLPAPAWLAVTAWYVLGTAEILSSVYGIYSGPQAFFYSHVAGFFPGPIYDDALGVSWPLLAFRLGTVLLGCVLLSLGGVARTGGRRIEAFALLAVSVAAFAALSLHGRDLGFSLDRDYVRARLEGKKATGRVDIAFTASPALKNEIGLITTALDSHIRDMEAVLGYRYGGVISVNIFKDAEEKKALMGMAGTNISKPWQSEIFVNQEAFPYPVARHELAHVILGQAAGGLLRLPGKGIFRISTGILEGAAVALELDGPELTKHQMARALLDEGLMPQMASIFGTSGFYAHQPGIAYTAAGSFMKWVLEAKGREIFLRIYRTGKVAESRDDAAKLFDEWKGFLKTVQADEDAAAVWLSAVKKPWIFNVKCAHQAALARQDAYEDSKRNRSIEAARSLESLCASACTGGDRKLIADYELKAGLYDSALDRYRGLLADPGTGLYIRVEATEGAGLACWFKGDMGCAAAAFDELSGLPVIGAKRRSADVYKAIFATGDRAFISGIADYFSDRLDSSVRPVLVAGVRGGSGGGDYLVREYLAGRFLFSKGAFGMALPHLESAAGKLGAASIEMENARLIAICRMAGGDNSGAAALLGELAQKGPAAWRAWIEGTARLVPAAGGGGDR